MSRGIRLVKRKKNSAQGVRRYSILASALFCSIVVQVLQTLTWFSCLRIIFQNNWQSFLCLKYSYHNVKNSSYVNVHKASTVVKYAPRATSTFVSFAAVLTRSQMFLTANLKEDRKILCKAINLYFHVFVTSQSFQTFLDIVIFRCITRACRNGLVNILQLFFYGSEKRNSCKKTKMLFFRKNR